MSDNKLSTSTGQPTFDVTEIIRLVPVKVMDCFLNNYEVLWTL